MAELTGCLANQIPKSVDVDEPVMSVFILQLIWSPT